MLYINFPVSVGNYNLYIEATTGSKIKAYRPVSLLCGIQTFKLKTKGADTETTDAVAEPISVIYNRKEKGSKEIIQAKTINDYFILKEYCNRDNTLPEKYQLRNYEGKAFVSEKLSMDEKHNIVITVDVAAVYLTILRLTTGTHLSTP